MLVGRLYIYSIPSSYSLKLWQLGTRPRPEPFRKDLLAGTIKISVICTWRKSGSYAIWVSEIMLPTNPGGYVIPYYPTFLAALPTVVDLAPEKLERT